MRPSLLTLAVLAMLVPRTPDAQAPTGAIAGVVRDSSETVMAVVHVVITNQDRSFARPVTTTASGDYIAPSLLPGAYDVTADAPGFQRWVKMQVIVEAGSTTTVNIRMAVAVSITETVIVSGRELPEQGRTFDDLPVGGGE